MPAFLFSQAGQDALGFGGRGQNTFHGGQGIGAEADRPLQGGQPVLAVVAGQKSQDMLGLVFTLTLPSQQAVQEAARCRP